MYMECLTYRPSIVESVHRSTLKSRNDSFQGMKIVQLKQFLYDSQIQKVELRIIQRRLYNVNIGAHLYTTLSEH